MVSELEPLYEGFPYLSCVIEYRNLEEATLKISIFKALENRLSCKHSFVLWHGLLIDGNGSFEVVVINCNRSFPCHVKPLLLYSSCCCLTVYLLWFYRRISHRTCSLTTYTLLVRWRDGLEVYTRHSNHWRASLLKVWSGSGLMRHSDSSRTGQPESFDWLNQCI